MAIYLREPFPESLFFGDKLLGGFPRAGVAALDRSNSEGCVSFTAMALFRLHRNEIELHLAGAAEDRIF